jgi:predicted nucleotidyltransferase
MNEIDIEGEKIFIIALEDLVQLKQQAKRPMDLYDISILKKLYPEVFSEEK